MSLALPVGFLSLFSRTTTGEQVDAADVIVVAKVSGLQFIEAPARTAIEFAVDHTIVGRAGSPTLNLIVDGRAPLKAGDAVVALIGRQPDALLGAYQIQKNPRTLEDEVVTDVTGMGAQGIHGGGANDPVLLDLLEMGIRARRGLPAAAVAGIGGANGTGGTTGQSGAPKGVTGVPADALEPNNDLASRTVVSLALPTLVTGNPLIVSGLTITTGDVDFFSFEASAFTLLYAATLPVTGLPVPDTYMGLFNVPPAELLETDDDSGLGQLSQFTYLFTEDSRYAVAVESAPDHLNLFDGSTGTTEGHYNLSLEVKLGSYMLNALDALIGVSRDGTFIEDFVGYQFVGGDDVLLRGVPADAWALDYFARPPSGATQVYGGSGEQLTDPLFLNAVAPISFELGPFTDAAGMNRRGFCEAAMMVLQSSAPERGVTATHTYTMSLFSQTLKGEVALQIGTDDPINDLVYTRVMDPDLFGDGIDTFHWSFDPNSSVKAFPVDPTQNVGNVVAPVLTAGSEADVDRQFALVIDDGDTPGNSFGETSRYKAGFTHIEGFATSAQALQEAVRRLRLETNATTWVVAVDQDPVSGLWGAFGAGLGP